MKIAIFSFFSGHVERGAENWTCEIAQRLTKHHEVTVFQNRLLKKDQKYGVYTTNLKVNWTVAKSKGTLLRKIFCDYWSLLLGKFTLLGLKHLRKMRADIVIPTNGGWQTFILRIFTYISRSKLVVVGHSGPGWDDRFNLYCFPDMFIALTPSAEKWANKVNKFVKTVTIPNGVDLAKFTAMGEKAVVSIRRPIYLAVGASEEGKRLDLAIRAVSQLDKGSLLILGGGYDEKKIQIFGKKLLGKRFVMKKVDFEDIPKYYRASDVFTLPSWKNEAFGMVYLEALACGLPVVATLDASRQFIIGDAGFFIDPVDTAAYSLSLAKAAKTNWGKKPRKQAEKFSWEIISKKYDDTFRNLLSK